MGHVQFSFIYFGILFSSIFWLPIIILTCHADKHDLPWFVISRIFRVLRDVLHSPREDGAVIPGWVRNFYTTIVPADISPCQGSSSLDANTTDCRVKTQSCRIFLTSHQFLYTYYWNTILWIVYILTSSSL